MKNMIVLIVIIPKFVINLLGGKNDKENIEIIPALLKHIYLE